MATTHSPHVTDAHLSRAGETPSTATACRRCHGTGVVSTRRQHRYCGCPAGREIRNAKLSLRGGADPNASGPPF